MFGPLRPWSSRLASCREICIQQGDGQPLCLVTVSHRTRVFVAPSVSVQTFLAPRHPRPKDQSRQVQSWHLQRLLGPWTQGDQRYQSHSFTTWHVRKVQSFFILPLKHILKLNTLPIQNTCQIRWEYWFFGYFSWGPPCTFRASAAVSLMMKREGTEENIKRKRSKDEGNMEAMEAMEAMKRKSENRKELNHQGEFDIVWSLFRDVVPSLGYSNQVWATPPRSNSEHEERKGRRNRKSTRAPKRETQGHKKEWNAQICTNNLKKR